LVEDATDSCRAPGVEPRAGQRVLKVVNKIDLAPALVANAVAVSALTGNGMDRLRESLAGLACALTQSHGPPPLTRARHRAALAGAVERLHAARAAVLPELRGEDLRLAMRAIGRVTGTVGVEDILDSIFRNFCIGK
jgi:tRNA modification GTPase